MQLDSCEAPQKECQLTLAQFIDGFGEFGEIVGKGHWIINDFRSDQRP
jgi:hypothetical protein